MKGGEVYLLAIRSTTNGKSRTCHKKNQNNTPFEIQTTMRNRYHNEKARHQAVSELTNQNIGKPLHTRQSTPPTPTCVKNYEGQFQKPAQSVMLNAVICKRSGTNCHNMQ
jgi:hypothetical protein